MNAILDPVGELKRLFPSKFLHYKVASFEVQFSLNGTKNTKYQNIKFL